MTLVHRRVLPILLLSSVMLFAGCATSGNVAHADAGPNLCFGGGGESNPYAPIVCIDDNLTKLPADPPTVHAVNLVPGKRRTVINWFTKSGNNLLVVSFDPNNARCFVTQPECEGSHCLAIINPDAQPGWQCKYSLKLANKSGYFDDPIVDIDACCPVFQ